uniref:Innexin n=1 Tax=Angiostrongylus cantonensis TaxID=6313 RepID=A0A0K0D4Q0_ANGCA
MRSTKGLFGGAHWVAFNIISSSRDWKQVAATQKTHKKVQQTASSGNIKNGRENYLKWGYEMSSNIIQGKEWKETSIFPRVIMCDFQIRRLANLQRHTVQCVIMMNMINEKLYLFLYFWLVFIFRFLAFKRAMAESEMRHFMGECLHPDGVLLLLFVREHAGGRIAFDLISKVYAIFCESNSLLNDSIKKQPISPIEKHSRPPHFVDFNRKPSSDQGYYPAISSAPTLEDYMDHGTIKIGEKDAQADQSARRSPTDV